MFSVIKTNFFFSISIRVLFDSVIDWSSMRFQSFCKIFWIRVETAGYKTYLFFIFTIFSYYTIINISIYMILSHYGMAVGSEICCLYSNLLFYPTSTHSTRKECLPLSRIFVHVRACAMLSCRRFANGYFA